MLTQRHLRTCAVPATLLHCWSCYVQFELYSVMVDDYLSVPTVSSDHLVRTYPILFVFVKGVVETSCKSLPQVLFSASVDKNWKVPLWRYHNKPKVFTVSWLSLPKLHGICVSQCSGGMFSNSFESVAHHCRREILHYEVIWLALPFIIRDVYKDSR